MTHLIVSVSQTDLTQRRRQLRRKRRVRLLQASWRILAISGLASGLVWLVTSPDWVLRRPEQVKIVGNQFFKADLVRSVLPIRYPQSLLKLEPQKLAAGLKAKMPLATVTVSRQLFPPGLTVQLEERKPVAIALPVAGDLQAVLAKSSKSPRQGPRPGLLDEGGNWIPLESYTAIDQSLKLPELKVIGNVESYRLSWARLYQEVGRSPVKVQEIDWRDPTNLTLKTELGTVYLGPYSSQLRYQLNVLDKMRQLPNRITADNLAYIDLRNPAVPAVKLGES